MHTGGKTERFDHSAEGFRFETDTCHGGMGSREFALQALQRSQPARWQKGMFMC